MADSIQKNKITTLIFDLGETILTFGKVGTAGLFKQGAKLSYDFLTQLGQPAGNFHIYCLRNLINLRLRYYLSSITRRDFDSLNLLKKLAQKTGVNLDPKQWLHLAWLWYEPLSKFAKIEPDLKKTLTELKQMNLKLAILSNTFIPAQSLDEHLKRLGLIDLFDFRFYSYQFSRRKPHLKIFTQTCERIDQPPENIMFIGDRIDNDITPALKLNMTAVLKDAYTNLDKPTPAGSHRINLLSQLPALVTQLNHQ